MTITVKLIYDIVQSTIVCRGARAAKGGGLKILWRRPSRVRIPSPALIILYLSLDGF